MLAGSAAALISGLPLPTLHAADWAVACALVAGFYLADAHPLHVEGRSQTFSLSMSELPFVLGLLFCPLDLLVLARFVGGGAALVFQRRQPMHKLAFNCSLQLLEASLGARLFWLVPMAAGISSLWRSGLAVVVAVLVPAVATIGAVTVVIRLYSGRWDAQTAKSFVRTGAAALLPNCCAGLIIAEAIRQSRASMIPALVLLGAFAVGYHAYVDLRRRHQTLEMIYEFARGIDGSARSDTRLRELLSQTREALRCGHAELAVFGADSSEPGERRALGTDNRLTLGPLAINGEDWPLAMVASTERPFLAARGTKEPGHLRFLAAHQWRDCLFVPLRDTERLVGVLGVANRVGDVTTFGRDDQRLLASIAGQMSSTLENGHLLDQLTYDSSHDALTGLVNRNTYQERLTIALGADSAEPHAVVLMDLDRFKDVNDTLGHHYGDLLIREVAERLRAAVPDIATIARLGGDEFALLLPGYDRHRAAAAAEMIRAAVAQPCSLDGVALDVEASIGISVSPDHGADATVLLKRADMAMYAAKRERTGIEFYDNDRDEYSPRRLTLASQVRNAASHGQLELHYQPQIDLTTGEFVAVEALMRWNHPELGTVPPSEFIHIAEQSGAISVLTRWALEEAIRQLACWRALGLRLDVSVNVSMRNLLDSSMTDHVAGLIDQHHIRPGSLTLEVTESQLMVDPDRTLPLLHRLTGLGVALSIDDFGTGYSSLAYLKQLPVREIKIDRSFVHSITTSREDVAIVKAVIELADTFGMIVVAEGVETHPTLELLKTLGCHRVQGYHLSRPLPAQDLPGWITRNNAEWREQIRHGGVSRFTTHNGSQFTRVRS